MATYSYSQITSFNQCMAKWHYQYSRGLEPVVATPAMELGSAVHAGLANHFLGGRAEEGIRSWASSIMPDWYKNPAMEEDMFLTGDIAELLQETVETATKICGRTIQRLDKNFEVLHRGGSPMVEMEISAQIAPGIKYTGKVDLVVRERFSGRVLLMDFKVRQNLSSETAHDFDVQMALYQYVLQKYHGVETHGSCIYQIRSELPKNPVLNKNGTMSRTSGILTDWETYREALVKNGLNPADYEDMKVVLADRAFEREIITYRGEETFEAIWSNFVATVRRIRAVRRNSIITRSISQMNCGGCTFRELCMAELYGQSTALILPSFRERGAS